MPTLLENRLQGHYSKDNLHVRAQFDPGFTLRGFIFFNVNDEISLWSQFALIERRAQEASEGPTRHSKARYIN